MAKSSLIIIPPLVKYVGGPLLGPALLVGAARDAGHPCWAVDLNVAWLRTELPTRSVGPPSPFIGDHDRPSSELRAIARRFASMLADTLPGYVGGLAEHPELSCLYHHEDIFASARRLAETSFGAWVRAELAAAPRPDVAGLSVLYSGQVLAALAVSFIARDMWPGVRVVWGGPHVTALADRIATDPRFGIAADGFVAGYAERTWVEILESVGVGRPLPPEVIRAGQATSVMRARDQTCVPCFDDLHRYGWGRLTLPAQCSRGCAYGRCTYCTYPAIEGAYRRLDRGPSSDVVARAAELDAAVSFKDSLLVVPAMMELARLIEGRVPWSATTKLSPTLAKHLPLLGRMGLRTIEVGLETLSPSMQLLADKRQSAGLFERTIDAAGTAGVSVVVNYITGFPGADAAEEQRWLDWTRARLADRPALVAKIEHNRFQLERMAPLGRAPSCAGIRVTEEWPWASILGWKSVMVEAA